MAKRRDKRSKKKRGRAKRQRAGATQATNSRLAGRGAASGPLPGWPIGTAEERQRQIADFEGRRALLTPAELAALGRLYVYEGCIDEDDRRIDDGVASLMEAAGGTEPHPEAVLDLSWVMALRGLSAMAMPYAKQATELMPDRRDAWAFYGRACADRGQLEEARRAMENACAQPDATAGDRQLLATLKDGTLPETTGNVMSFFTPELEELHHHVVGADESLKYQLFVLRQALAAAPDDLSLLYANALARYKLGQHERASALAQQLLAREPSHADACTLVALIQQKGGDVEGAVEWYQAAIEGNPGHVLANSNLAKHLLDAGQASPARQLLERALQTDPDYAIAVDLLGNAVGQLDGDFAEEARLHLRAIELDPSRPLFHANLILSLVQDGQFRAADRAWKKVKNKLAASTEAAEVVPLLTAILEPPADFALFEFALGMKDRLGGTAMRRIISRMHDGVRQALPRSDWSKGYSDVGLLAYQCEQPDLELKAFEAAERLAGRGGGETLNLAVALSRSGRLPEGLELAMKVPEAEGRCLTIRGNLLWDSGRLEEAFEHYRRAVKVDVGFLLPISNGTEIGLGLGLFDEVAELHEALEHVEDADLEAALLRARLEYAYGHPWAVESLVGPLLDDQLDGPEEKGESARRLLEAIESGEDAERVLELVEELDTELPDLTVQRSDSAEGSAWQLRAKALWACGRPEAALGVLEIGLSIVPGDGDWTVLQSECQRAAGDEEGAAWRLGTMTPQPPPLISRALLALAAGESDEAEELATQAASLEVEGRNYSHPLGRPRALEQTILAAVALSRGETATGGELASSAAAEDPHSPFVRLQLVQALQDAGRTHEAVEEALAGLAAAAGHPGLLQWCIDSYLDLNEPQNADELLAKHREAAVRRGGSELAAQLGEQIARAQLGASQGEVAPSSRDALEWDWLGDLQPASQTWLESAVVNVDRARWLRLGLAFYLCKVAEMELVHRLVLPFRDQSAGQFAPDRRLRDLGDFLEGRRPPPGLGAVLQALRVAAERGRPGDNGLVPAWMKFVRSRPWNGASSLRSRSFLGKLAQLMNARNRMAHLGDLAEDEFEELLAFMVDGENPGEFFRALGVEAIAP